MARPLSHRRAGVGRATARKFAAGALVTAHAEIASVAAGERLSALAALAHRLERGMRLM